MKDRAKPDVYFNDDIELIRTEVRPIDKTNLDLGYRFSAAASARHVTSMEGTNFEVSACDRGDPRYAWSMIDLELPSQGEQVGEVLNVPIISQAMRAFADIWHPDWMSVWDLRTDLIPMPWHGGPSLAWINYLSPAIADVDKDLPEGWIWFQVDPGFSVLVSQDWLEISRLAPEDAAVLSERYRTIQTCIHWKKML